MIITEKATKLILEALKKYQKDYCHISLLTHCCGNKQIDLRLILANEVTNLVDFGSIKIDMTLEAIDFFKDFTLDKKGNGLSFIPPKGWEPPHQNECHSKESPCKEGSCSCHK